MSIVPDQPIVDPAEDRLGLADFAKHLANTLTHPLSVEGYVVAVNAPWGAGKTTFLNFVTHYASLEGNVAPIVLKFNPWWFSGQSVVQRFFRELLAALGTESKWDQVRTKLANLAEMVSPVLFAVPAAGSALGAVGKLSENLLKENQTTERLKAELAADLRGLDRRLLVVVDDIDRLTREEIRQLFQLIKTVGDLPNVTYLLAFHREHVVEALKTDGGVSGEDYLAKIVQAAFELPEVDTSSLHTLFTERLDVILSGTPDQDFDESYWLEAFHEGIKHLVKTPRDVTRLTSSLGVTYSAVKGEVNPVDFIALETLRLFAPDAYSAIRQEVSAFTGSGASSMDRRAEELKSFHDTWLEQVPVELRQAVKSLVTVLFPKLSAVWLNVHYSPESTWMLRRRICHPEVFPIYFRLSVPSNLISNSEMASILALHSDAGALSKRLMEMNAERSTTGERRSRLFLNQLDERVSEIDSDTALGLMRSLFYAADGLYRDVDPAGFLQFGMETALDIVMLKLARQVSTETIEKELPPLLESAGSVALVVRFVFALGEEHGKYGDRRNRLHTPAAPEELVERLEKIAIKRVETAAVDSSLLQTPQLSYTLHRWRQMADEKAPTTWVQAIVQENDENLLLLLHAFEGAVTSTSGYKVVRTKTCDPRQLEPFLIGDEIIDRVRSLAESDELASIYARSYDLLKEGKDPRRQGI